MLSVLRDWTTAVHHNTQLTTSSLLQFPENHGIQKPCSRVSTGQPISKQKVLGRHGTPEEALHQEIVLVQLAQHSLLHRFPDSRHTDENRRLELADITLAVAHRPIRQRTGVTVSHGTTPEETQVLEHELEDVGLREIRQQSVRGTDVFSNDLVNTSSYP